MDLIPIVDVINALLDISVPFPSSYLHVFSDINEHDLAAISQIWDKVAVHRKVNLLTEFERLMEVDTLLSFDDIARLALRDNDPNVRSKAIALLWENEDPQLAIEFSNMLEHDQDEVVQLSVAEALGRFVLLGELEEIPPRITQKIIDLLLRVFSIHPSKEVRQEILKSLAYANLPEIGQVIAARINDPDLTWQLAAIIAMGRSADERWEKSILKMLKSPHLSHQIEAVRSAGELELSSARRPLLEMLDNKIQDDDLRYQIIWSLAKIGGMEVKETLEKLLEEAETDDEADVIDMALDYLIFNDELPSLDFS